MKTAYLTKHQLPAETGRYGFAVTVPFDYEQAKETMVEARKTEGFGVLTEIDVKETLKRKLDVDFRKYAILGAYNPSLAYKALQAEPDLGLLLPCNVVVQEVEGGARIAFVDPQAMLGVASNPELSALGDEVRDRLEKVAGRLAKSVP